MVLQCLLIAFSLVASSTAIRFQGRASANHAAPFSNSTTKAEFLIPTAAAAPQTLPVVAPFHNSYIAETAFSTRYPNPEPADTSPTPVGFDNATLYNYTRTSNASCTVHVPDASIEWWFPPTFRHALATITATRDNSSNRIYTFLPHTTSFDAVSALATENVCTSGWTTYTEWDWTAWECVPYTEKPTAASTNTVYRTAAPAIPSGSKIPISDVLLYDILLDELPSMTTTISIAHNTTTVETAPTPFVHFTAYEIEHENHTETIQLNSVYVQSYWRKGIEHDPTATGPIPDGFMEQIPQSACEAGNLQAVVTVLILVDLYYVNQPTFAPDIVHWESTALGWEDDQPAGIMEESPSGLKPHIMTDWGLSGTMAEPANPVTARPSQSPDPVPLTKAGKESKAAQPESSLRQTVGTIGTAPVVIAGPSPVVIVGSQTLKPGGPAITIGGTTVALASPASAIIIGGTSLPLPQNLKPGQQQTVGTFGTVPVVLGPSSIVTVGSQTLRPGGIAITIGQGTVVSLASPATALVVGGSTLPLPQIGSLAVQPATVPAANRPPPVITIGRNTFVPNAATQFFVASGQTLTPGGTVEIGGTKVSLDSSAAFLVVGSSTQRLSASEEALRALPELVLGSSTLTALSTSNNPSDSDNENDQEVSRLSSLGPVFVISGQTLVPGGVPITVYGTVLSLAPFGSFLLIDGSTTTVATPTAVAATQVTPPPLTIGNSVFNLVPGTGTTYQVGTALLTPGGSVVVAGTTVSLAAGATALIISGVTTTLAAQAQPIVTNPPLLTIRGQTYTAVPGTGTMFVIGGQTLTPGGTITVDGMTVILSPQATELVYGSSGRSTSTALFPATTTRGPTTASAVSASERQSGGGQAALTSTAEAKAPRSQLPVRFLLSALGYWLWLLI